MGQEHLTIVTPELKMYISSLEIELQASREEIERLHEKIKAYKNRICELKEGR